MATITVYREYGVPLAARIKVFVDGTLVTALRHESSVDITADEGRHTVRIALAWQASAPVDVVLDAEDRVTLRARIDSRANSITGFFRRPGEALDLDVVAGPPLIPSGRIQQVDVRRT